MDFEVAENVRVHDSYTLLKLRPAASAAMPPMIPGQFVQVAVPDAPHTMLRRPISVNNVEDGCLWLLIRHAGEGTRTLASMQPGRVLNLLLPLGNGFAMPHDTGCRPLLVGGGVGIAPMLFMAKRLCETGIRPDVLIGARTASDLLQLDELRRYATVHISTDDGSCGEPGVVTLNSCLGNSWDVIYCCGPTPMMRAVARHARHNGIRCYVSLENMMACGIGACLCCVEKTVRGNVCVCTEGPVFDIDMLTWED